MGTLVEKGFIKSAKHKLVQGKLLARTEFDIFVPLQWKLKEGESAKDHMIELAKAGLLDPTEETIEDIVAHFTKSTDRWFWEVSIYQAKVEKI